MRINLLAGFLIILGAFLVIFYPSLNYYFFQDDWFVLNRLSFSELISFFTPRSDVIYYRPIGMQMYFFLSKTIFGLKPFAFHIVAFLFQVINIFLIFKIILKLFNDKLAAIMAAFIFATAAFHFMSLSWLALSWNIIGMTFFLIALNFYLDWKKTKNRKKLLYTTIFFVFCLGSTEFAILIPFFLITLNIFFFSNKEKAYPKEEPLFFLIMFSAVFIYLVSRLFLFSVPASGEYQIEISSSFFKTFFWYVLWLFNFPEELKYQIVISKFYLTETIVKDAGVLLFPSLFFSLGSMIIFGLLLILCKLDRKIYLFSLSTFILFLLPVLFLPNHTYPYYLTFSSVSLLIVLSAIIATKNRNKYLYKFIFLFSIFWFMSSFFSVNISQKIHWIVSEQSLSKKALNKIREKFPRIPPNSTVLIQTTNKMLKQTFFNEEALKVIYNDKTIKTDYLISNKVIDPENIWTSYYLKFNGN